MYNISLEHWPKAILVQLDHDWEGAQRIRANLQEMIEAFRAKLKEVQGTNAKFNVVWKGVANCTAPFWVSLEAIQILASEAAQLKSYLDKALVYTPDASAKMQLQFIVGLIRPSRPFLIYDNFEECISAIN